LEELRSNQLLQDLAVSQRQMAQLRVRQAEAAERKRQDEKNEQAAEARRQKQEELRKAMMKSVIKLQSMVRSMLVRKQILPDLKERRRLLMLEQQRAELEVQLRELRHTVHGITYLEEQRVAAAVRLQAWWRGILAVRVVKVLCLRGKIEDVHRHMDRAAQLIQAMVRGRLDRVLVADLRERLFAQSRLTAEQEEARKLRMVVKVQAWFRGLRSRHNTSRRHDRLTAQRAQGVFIAEALLEGRRSMKRSSISRDSQLSLTGALSRAKRADRKQRASVKGGTLPMLKKSKGGGPTSSASALQKKRADGLPAVNTQHRGTIMCGMNLAAKPRSRVSMKATRASMHA